MADANERLERIKEKGHGILIIAVIDGKEEWIHEASHETDIYCLRRAALYAVTELATQETFWKLAREKGLI